MPEHFELHGVVHLVRPIGYRAHDLESLRVGIAGASAQTLFYHAYQPQLRYSAVTDLPPDDFSAWVNGVVQDRETAERLSFAVQHRAGSCAELRDALVQVLLSVPEKARLQRAAPDEGDFVFLEMDSVAVETGRYASDSVELMQHLAEVEPVVIFYHLVEQPWLDPERPSLIHWVEKGGDRRLAEWLRLSLMSGLPLEEGRRRLMRRWRQSRLGRSVAEATASPEHERREAGRRAVAGLVRRITQSERSDDPGHDS